MAFEKNASCLVIGANGLVGRRIGRDLTNRGIKWVGTYGKRAEESLLKLDITEHSELKNIFSEISPSIVFNCANLAGGVDFCEANPDKATDFHIEATMAIGRHCKDIDATMVFISTDYVFNGANGPYKEDDAPDPLNLYGGLKLKAERWIQDNLQKYLIIRTTNVYGWDPDTVTPNYIMGLYRSLGNGKPFNAPSFLWGNPTYVGDLSGAIIELYIKKANGAFHVVGSSFINRYDWAIEACKGFKLDSSLINEIKQPSANMVPRPMKSWLCADKFTKSNETILHDVSAGLELMKTDMGKS